MKLELNHLQYIENYVIEVSNLLPYKSERKNRVINDFRADIHEAYEHQESWVSPNNIFGYSDEAARNIAKSANWDTETAGWLRRIFAFAIDSVFLIMIYSLSFLVIVKGWILIFGERSIDRNAENGKPEFSNEEIVLAIIIVLLYFSFLFAFAVFYWIAPEKLYGKSLGKKLLGLIVVDYNGIKMTWEQAIVRNLTKIVGEFLFFDFLLGIIINEDPSKSQRAMDQLAKTEVLKLK